MTASIAFMNNKGGVGKTTLLANLAHHLTENYAKKVLVIDLDPQCNVSQLLLTDHDWTEIFGGERRASEERSVLHALRSIRKGDSTVHSDVEIFTSARFGIDLVSGHPTLALVEDRLSSSWEDLLRGDLGGARRTYWLRELIRSYDQYDYVLVDAGPSLGALNRTVMIGTDLFLTPTSADLFSLFALDNIGEWIRNWSRSHSNGMRIVAEDFPEEFADYSFDKAESHPGARYLGYTIQQYVTKALRDGARRNTNAYDRYRQQIPARAKRLAERAGGGADDLNYDVGLVPYMFAMVPLAQSVHAPIASLTNQDGLRGAQISQQARYRDQIAELGNRFMEQLDAAK